MSEEILKESEMFVPEVEPLDLPTGTISMSQVNTELIKPTTGRISLGDADVRKLAKRTSGTISMSDLRGKSNKIATLTVGWRAPQDRYYGFSAYGWGDLQPRSDLIPGYTLDMLMFELNDSSSTTNNKTFISNTRPTEGNFPQGMRVRVTIDGLTAILTADYASWHRFNYLTVPGDVFKLRGRQGKVLSVQEMVVL